MAFLPSSLNVFNFYESEYEVKMFEIINQNFIKSLFLK